jgi:hypothetical protein
MLLLTTWKNRPLNPEQQQRLMKVWAAQLERQTKDPAWKQLFFYMHADGSGGATVADLPDTDKAAARGLQECIELTEFLELETRFVLTQEQAMPSILAAMATTAG